MRVSTDKQETLTQRQRDAVDLICVKVLTRVTGTFSFDQHHALQAAVHYRRPDDFLTVQSVGRFDRNLLDGLVVLADLSSAASGVKVFDDIAVGENTERSLVLAPLLALAQDRRRHIVRKTRNGVDAARKRRGDPARRGVRAGRTFSPAALRIKNHGPMQPIGKRFGARRRR